MAYSSPPGVRTGPWNGIGSFNSRTRISRLVGALQTGLIQKTVWYTEHAREECEGRVKREDRQARAGVGGMAMAGGRARGGQPGREVEAMGAEAKALAAARQRMAEGRRRDT